MHIAKAAVVGAGTMGSGIAQVISSSGVPVILRDVDPGQLERARARIEGIYRQQVERGRLAPEEMPQKLALVCYALDDGGLDEVDIVIEAVPEHMALKRAVWAGLNGVCHPETVFATNTSALSITEMGAASGRPHKLIGMHFFNPAHLMRLVEVIPGSETDGETVDTVVDLAQRLGKVPVVVRECPGFLVNRLLMPYLDEAVICLQEGAATTIEIDAAMGRAGFGWPMGPFALMDMLGLDVCHHIAAYLASQYGERMAEPALLQALFEAGRLGRKSGRGFYDYPGGKHASAVDALIQQLQEQGRVAQAGSVFSAGRLMARLLNEAFLCLEQEVASAADIDLACVTGLGMQVRREAELVRMGPLEYTRTIGTGMLLRQLWDLERKLGLRFRPAATLVRAGGG